MRQVIKGVALLVFLAILIFIIWCFILGKCSGKGFGVVPPRPNTRASGRRPSNENGLNISGSGSGGAGVGGSGNGSVELQPAATTKEDCGFLGLGCAGKTLMDFFNRAGKNISEGRTIFESESVKLGQGPARVQPRIFIKP